MLYQVGQTRPLGDRIESLLNESGGYLIEYDGFDNALYQMAMYSKVCESHNAGKYNEALELEERLLEKQPNNALYRSTHAMTLSAMKCYEDALCEAQYAVRLEPNSAQYHKRLVMILFGMDRMEEAIAELWRLDELDPDGATHIILDLMKGYADALGEI